MKIEIDSNQPPLENIRYHFIYLFINFKDVVRHVINTSRYDFCLDQLSETSRSWPNQSVVLRSYFVAFSFCDVEKPHDCSECAELFSSLEALNEHTCAHLIQQKNTGKKSRSKKHDFPCSRCSDSSFNLGSDEKSCSCPEKTQESISQAQVHTCSKCNKGFLSANALQQHQRAHAEGKPYSCTECNRSFSRLQYLKRHAKIHSGEKPHVCSECSSAFLRFNELKLHLRIHSGEKPYSCTECSKSFALPGELSKHAFVHSGEKPYTCAECFKSFSQSCNLKAHMRIHSGEKPYRCPKCPRAFTHSATLRKHVSIHSWDLPDFS
jgi:KRAB domain-containing zinc finger protein